MYIIRPKKGRWAIVLIGLAFEHIHLSVFTVERWTHSFYFKTLGIKEKKITPQNILHWH